MTKGRLDLMGAALANKNKTLGQVQKHISREQYDRAIKLLQQLVEEDPNDVRSLLKLGDVYVKKGDRDIAVDVYKRVAKQYSEQGFFMKAVAIYKQILKHQSKNIEALMQLAELYEHLGLASEARQQYLLAESVLHEQGDTDKALALMQKQVELDPDNVAHRIKLAEAYSSQDNIAAATRQFAAAAEVLRRQNREEDFIKVAERLVYHDANRPEILRDLARLYLARGDAKRALAKLQLCFRSQPKDVETLELLAQAFSELRQYARTKTVYQELVQVLEDKGLVGKAEEYRLLIRQLEEAERPSPNSPGLILQDDIGLPLGRTTGDLMPGPALGGPPSDYPLAAGASGGSYGVPAASGYSAPEAYAAADAVSGGGYGAPEGASGGYGVPNGASAGYDGGASAAAFAAPSSPDFGGSEYPLAGAYAPSDHASTNYPPPEYPSELGAGDYVAEPVFEADDAVESTFDANGHDHNGFAYAYPTDGQPLDATNGALAQDAGPYRYPSDAFEIDNSTAGAEVETDDGLPVPPSSSFDASAEETSALDDLIIEPPEEAPLDAAQMAPPPPPQPEASIDQQISDLVRDAKVYQRYNLPAGALEQLQRALELDPDNVSVLEHMRDLYITEGDPNRAADVIAELVRVHFRNGDRDAAEAAKRHIAQLSPSHPLAIDAMPNSPLPDPEPTDDSSSGFGHADHGEDSLSFVITEDSGSFEIVDVADSGSIPDLQLSDADAPSHTNDALPEPEFEPDPPVNLDDDEPLQPFTSDLLNAPLDVASTDDAVVNGHAPISAFADNAFDIDDPLEETHALPEDPTTLGEPLSKEDDPFRETGHDNYARTNGHASDSDPAAALGSPIAIRYESESEIEPVTQAEYPESSNGRAAPPRATSSITAMPDLTDELAEVQFFLDVGDEDGAQEALRDLVEQYPSHPEVMALAMALDVETLRGRKPERVTSDDLQEAFDKALEETAVESDPSEVQDVYDQGMALMEIDRTAQAIEAFEKAAEWPSMAATAREMLVRCYAKMDQPAQAVAHYRDAEAHGVSGAAATHLKYLVAACFERTGDLTHALEWYESCADDDPTHHDVQQDVKRVALLVFGAAQNEEPADRRNSKISYL